MARRRVRAAVRKHEANEANGIALGVRAVAIEIGGHVVPGALWWTAPLAYVAEGMAAKAIEHRGVPADELDDLVAYFMAGLQEVVHAAFGEFDVAHYRAWIEALKRGEVAASG